jgi:hypothetical protein
MTGKRMVTLPELFLIDFILWELGFLVIKGVVA